MSIPEKSDTQMSSETNEGNKTNTSKSKSFADNVNDAISQMKQDDKGVWQVPETITDEAVRFAAMSEKRFRDTQSSYTKVKQSNKALAAEKALLRNKVIGSAPIELTPEQMEELEDLKFSDPEEWRKKMNNYENKSRSAYEAKLEDEVKQVSTATLEENELEDRKDVLARFNEEFPDFIINDDVIENDIPPRITNKLRNGTVTFKEFLDECYNYSKTGKVIKQTDDGTKMVNMSNIGGGANPDESAMEEDSITTYSKEVY